MLFEGFGIYSYSLPLTCWGCRQTLPHLSWFPFLNTEIKVISSLTLFIPSRKDQLKLRFLLILGYNLVFLYMAGIEVWEVLALSALSVLCLGKRGYLPAMLLTAFMTPKVWHAQAQKSRLGSYSADFYKSSVGGLRFWLSELYYVMNRCSVEVHNLISTVITYRHTFFYIRVWEK